MPQIILSKNDFFYFEHFISQPNFVTNKTVQGEIFEMKKIDNYFDLKNKIILIENADPGYDGIFNHDIAGLVTMYGGANSHMALFRVSLPSTIGLVLKNIKN